MSPAPNYEQLLIDAARMRGSQEWGLATRPDRALRAARFAALREPKWRLLLAVEIAWFARSSDDAGDDLWPYDRFADRLREPALRAAGTHLPDEVRIQRAVEEVLGILASVARERRRADEPRDWFEANIERPMAQRHLARALGSNAGCG